MKKFNVGDRVKVFDHLLFKDDISTPPEKTFQPAIVIKGNYTKSGYEAEEMIDVIYDRLDRKNRESRGHFVWGVIPLITEKRRTDENIPVV